MGRQMIPFDEAVGRELLTRSGSEGGTNRRQLRQMQKALTQAMGIVLTPLERQELLLYYVKGLTLTQIGEMTGTCPSTVQRNIRRGVNKLKKTLRCCI